MTTRSLVTFDDLKTAWTWQPIPICPGRFVLSSPRPDLTPGELVGTATHLHDFHVPTARDAVIVALLVGGGLISYRRANGSYVHTLNTVEGFERKLLDLGIPLVDR